jgi:nucleoside-diphosphate-sugar epimerase
MRALVTGAAGFLGRYVVEKLIARGDSVTALVRRPDEHLQSLGATLAFGDLTVSAAVMAACEGVDAVFHVAARAGLAGPWKQYFEPNYRGTVNVLSGCHLHGVRKLVFTSSPSVTFSGIDQKNVDESAPYPEHWLAWYPQTKAMAEQRVLASNGQDGLFTCALRPHLIWGPRDSHLIPKLIDRARSGRLRRVGDGTNLVDMIYVENAADAHLQACDALEPGSPVAGQAYFLSNGEPVNCWGWINELLALAGQPPVTRSISFRAAYAIGAACEAAWKVTGRTSDPPMTRFLAAQLATHHYFDISKARRDFGYVPRISKEEGMRALAAACRWSSR